MREVPSLEDMTPNDWVAALGVMRDQLVEDAARVLDRYDTSGPAADELQRIFERYEHIGESRPFASEATRSGVSVDVRDHDERIVFWVVPTEDYQSIVRIDGQWWFDHHLPTGNTYTTHQLHREVIDRVVSMLPWGNDDDLLELAAIEMASRAGE